MNALVNHNILMIGMKILHNIENKWSFMYFHSFLYRHQLNRHYSVRTPDYIYLFSFSYSTKQFHLPVNQLNKKPLELKYLSAKV